MRLEIPNLEAQDNETAPALSRRSWSHRELASARILWCLNHIVALTRHILRTATQDGILHHRYIPTVGQPGKHDASYTTFCPPPPGKAPIKHYETVQESKWSQVRLDIHESSWEQLPTLWNVVHALRAVPRHEVLEVAMQTFAGPSDLLSNQRVD